MPLGQFFTWDEMTRSSTASRQGIHNQPPAAERAALRSLVAHVLDPLRAHIGRPVRVTSGYRSPELNAAIGGSKTSQHMAGEAADIKVSGIPADTLAACIVRLGYPFDQVIWYDPERGGHVHVSFTERRENRGQVLHAPAGGGYRDWSPS